MRATLDHFEIPVVDAKRLSEFLEAVFAWPPEEPASDGYRRLRAAGRGTGPASGAAEPQIRVGLYEGPRETLDRPTPVVRIDGEALEGCLDRVTRAGGRVLLAPRPVGATGRFARFEDPEGNAWGLWEPAS